jgi:MtN3 and saliva related transmembrane protein
MLATLIGSLAAILTTVCFIPQAIKIIRTHETAGISALMYATFSAGVACWLVYGILTVQWNIILCNVVTLPLSLTVLIMKLKLSQK